MRWAAILGLVAMGPLAFNPSLVVARDGVSIALCSGDGGSRAVSLPLAPSKLPGEDSDRCCGKACHAGSSRKRQFRAV